MLKYLHPKLIFSPDSIYLRLDTVQPILVKVVLDNFLTLDSGGTFMAAATALLSFKKLPHGMILLTKFAIRHLEAFVQRDQQNVAA